MFFNQDKINLLKSHKHEHTVGCQCSVMVRELALSGGTAVLSMVINLIA